MPGDGPTLVRMPEQQSPISGGVVARFALYCVLAGVLVAGLLFPVVGGAGLLANQAADVGAQDSAQVVQGDMPIVSTMVDAAGNPIAWLYTQRRWQIPGDRIADTMKLAIVSIEDKRFADHNGVDLQGTLTGLAGYLKGAVDTRGGSTIEQQYVKNYNLLVNAQTDAERRAAVEVTPARKLREIRMALALDKVLSKPEILTRYLNLVAFGNGAYGVQDAARTYFGINASQLNWQQAALLAGMVQSTSMLNPYTNPQGALDRRNLVLDTMIDNLPDKADELRAAKEQPLGILPQPDGLPQGCIAAGDRAFYCDYALQYLARAGISKEDVARNGYLIKTNLDPKIQSSVKKAVDSIASPDLDGVASVMSVIRPGKDSHRVAAMADNRTYGLKLDAGQTVQPQPFSLAGDGADAPVLGEEQPADAGAELAPVDAVPEAAALSHLLELDALDLQILEALAREERSSPRERELAAARSREGAKLASILRARCDDIEAQVARVRPRIPAVHAAWTEKMNARLREAGLDPDQDRIQQELSLYLAKIDVDEELSRLTTHVDEVRRILSAGGTVGKRLDFLAQELHREANTLGSKSADAEVSRAALELKVLIEQMREQVQNLE